MFVSKNIQNIFCNFATRMLTNKCSLLRLAGSCISTDRIKAADSSTALVWLRVPQYWIFYSKINKNWNDCGSTQFFFGKCCVSAAILQCRNAKKNIFFVFTFLSRQKEQKDQTLPKICQCFPGTNKSYLQTITKIATRTRKLKTCNYKDQDGWTETNLFSQVFVFF